MSKDMNYDGV